jgi:putative transcriptional regulator
MDKKKFLKALGQHIVVLRKKKSMSQSQLANICGKDRQSIARVENGESNPTAFYLNELAEALGTPVKDLLDFKK